MRPPDGGLRRLAAALWPLDDRVHLALALAAATCIAMELFT